MQALTSPTLEGKWAGLGIPSDDGRILMPGFKFIAAMIPEI